MVSIRSHSWMMSHKGKRRVFLRGQATSACPRGGGDWEWANLTGAFNCTYLSECILEHQSSSIWFRYMIRSASHTSELRCDHSNVWRVHSYIGAPMYEPLAPDGRGFKSFWGCWCSDQLVHLFNPKFDPPLRISN